MRILLSLLLLLAVSVSAQTVSRSELVSTNFNLLRSSTNISRTEITRSNSIQRLSVTGGGNYWTDGTNGNPAFVGQFGVSYSGDLTPYLWFGDRTGVGGFSGKPINFPGGIASVGQLYFVPSNALNASTYFYVNGGPHFSTFSNAFVNGAGTGAIADHGVLINNANPFSSGSHVSIVMYGTNVMGEVQFTNENGVVIYKHEPFGLTWIAVPDAYSMYVTNNPSGYFGIWDKQYPLQFAVNGNMPGDDSRVIWQRPYQIFDSRYFTNNSLPMATLFPMAVPSVVNFTNRLLTFALAIDHITGKVYVTNAPLVVTNLLSTSTNAGANVLGGAYGQSAVNNLNGGTMFNLNSAVSLNEAIATFDGAELRRSGILLQSGKYPFWAYATNASFVIAYSSATDVGTNKAAATFFTQLQMSNGVARLFIPSTFAEPVTANTLTVSNGLRFATALVSGVQGANTNYYLFSTNADRYINGFTNVSIRSVTGYSAGNPDYWNLTITNLNGTDRTIEFSAVTNHWNFLGLPAPTTLTNGTLLFLSARQDGSNIVVGYSSTAYP